MQPNDFILLFSTMMLKSPVSLAIVLVSLLCVLCTECLLGFCGRNETSGSQTDVVDLRHADDKSTPSASQYWFAWRNRYFSGQGQDCVRLSVLSTQRLVLARRSELYY